MEKFMFDAMMKGFVKNQINYDEKYLETLAKSNDPSDSTKLNSTIINILEADDTDALKCLIAIEGIDFSSKQYDGKTPLSIAVSAVSINTVKAILNQMRYPQIFLYNHGNLLRLDFPKILPTLWLIEDVIKIINLLLDKDLNISVENKLAITEFLVHNIDDCDCSKSDVYGENLKKKFNNLITHGSAIHVKNIVNNIQEQMDANRIILPDDDFINYIRQPLGPAYLLDLYIDKDVVKTIENIEPDWENGFILRIHHGDEILRMRTHELIGTELTVHDLLNMNPRDSYDHVSNIDFHELSQTYPFAADYMKGLKAKSLIRHQVKDFLPDFMYALFPSSFRICFHEVLPYLILLDNEDILNIGRAAFA